MYNVLGDPALVSEWQNLITAFAKRPFNFGGYSSIDVILDKLGVNVILESGIVSKRGVPKELEEAKKFWEEKCRELCEENRGTNNDEIEKAKGIKGMVDKDIDSWGMMLLRGRYIPDKKVIKLYPDEMEGEYGGKRMEELIVSTLAHETMHAYFNRPGHDIYPYLVIVEEPLAEFGMLLYLKKTDCVFYDWAKADTENKDCYRYGAMLMDLYIGGKEQFRSILEAYKPDVDFLLQLWMPLFNNNLNVKP